MQAAFEERVLPQLKGVAKAIYSTGRFVSSEAGVAVFELDNVHALERAEKKRSEVDSILAEALGRPIDLQLVAASDRPPGAGGAGGQHSEPAGTANQFHDSSAAAEQTAAEELDEALTIDVTELEDAGDVAVTGYDRLAAAFPGATLIDPDEVK